MTHELKTLTNHRSVTRAISAEFACLPVEPDSPTLTSILLFNAAQRACQKLDQISQIPHPWRDVLITTIVAEKALFVDALTVPDTHAPCRLLVTHTEQLPSRVRHIYRRAYLSELAEHSAAYFGHFEASGVPVHILQCLQALCDQERLIESLERLVYESPKVGPCPQNK